MRQWDNCMRAAGAAVPVVPELRRLLTLIPQDPFMLEGTVCSNDVERYVR